MNRRIRNVTRGRYNRRQFNRSALAGGIAASASGALLSGRRAFAQEATPAAGGPPPVIEGVEQLDLTSLSPGVPEPTEPVTITFLSWVSDSEILRLLGEQFQQIHPNITVEFEGIPAEQLNDILTTRIAGGNPSDTVYMDASSVAAFASRNALVNLDPYITESVAVVKEDYVDAFAASAIWEDSMYGLPIDGESTALFYRTDRFEAAGITAPPTTWEEFEAAAQAMTLPDQQQYGYIMFAPEAAYYWYPWLWQNGGEIFSEDGTEILFTSPEAKESADFYAGLAQYSPEDYYNSNSYDGRVAFATGQVGMYMAGAWLVATLKNQFPDINDLWTTAPLPERKQCATTIAGDCLAIPALSQNQDAAWKWIEFLSAPQNMALWNVGTPEEPGSLLPPRTSLLDNPNIFENLPELEAFAELMSCGVSGGAANPDGPAIEEAINLQLGRAIYGEISGSQALEEAALEVQDIITQ